ncbi:phage structural protein [Lactiplantibacillus plantarum]|uniref:phage structural protein n=1 Tax=Lactiplantibacillus plantarum TaxID=1590 RepID=UPI003F533474
MANKWDYDATQCSIVVNGTKIYGFQDGDMVSGERANDFVDLATDAQGWTMFNVNNDRHGTITLNISAGSPINAYLMQLCDGQTEVPISITTPHEHVYSNSARIQKAPAFSAGKTAGNRAYAFLCGDYNDKITA